MAPTAVKCPDDINVKQLVALREGALAGQLVLLAIAVLLDLRVSWGHRREL